jgi:hypothetical protein
VKNVAEETLLNVDSGAEKIERLMDGDKPSTEEYVPEKPAVEGDDVKPDEVVPRYRVVIDGQERELTEDELKAGYMMQADYTRKTQELSDHRNKLDEERQYFERLKSEQEAYIQHYTVIEALSAKIKALDKLDWGKLKDEDHMEYIKLKDEYRDYVDARNNAYLALEHAKAQTSNEYQQNVAKVLIEGQKILSRDIPGWGKELQEKLIGFGASHGFERDELLSVYDPRQVKILHKAYLYDQLQSKKVEIPSKAKTAPPKVVRPGHSVDDAERRKIAKDESMSRLRKTGRIDDAAAALEKLLG